MIQTSLQVPIPENKRTIHQDKATVKAGKKEEIKFY